MLGVIEKSWMEAVHAAPVGVALLNNRFHVVVEHFHRHATERRKGIL